MNCGWMVLFCVTNSTRKSGPPLENSHSTASKCKKSKPGIAIQSRIPLTPVVSQHTRANLRVTHVILTRQFVPTLSANTTASAPYGSMRSGCCVANVYIHKTCSNHHSGRGVLGCAAVRIPAPGPAGASGYNRTREVPAAAQAASLPTGGAPFGASAAHRHGRAGVSEGLGLGLGKGPSSGLCVHYVSGRANVGFLSKVVGAGCVCPKVVGISTVASAVKSEYGQACTSGT